MDAFDHCEQLVRETDKDRYLATLFSPVKSRRALFALYAFNSEIARVRETIRQAMAGEIRLQWWREAIEKPGTGDAMGSPVASALLDTLVRFHLPPAALVALIEARAFDLYDDPMPTLAALEAYANDTSSRLIDLAATILAGRRPGALEAIRHGGIAYAITGLLRAFPLHASRGQLYVPVEVLERHGAKSEDIFSGRATREISAALGELRAIGRAHFDGYAAAAATIPAAAASALLPISLVPLYLNRLERFGDQPFRVADVAPWRRPWKLWRAARRM